MGKGLAWTPKLAESLWSSAKCVPHFIWVQLPGAAGVGLASGPCPGLAHGALVLEVHVEGVRKRLLCALDVCAHNLFQLDLTFEGD